MTEIACACGAVALSLVGQPILAAECHALQKPRADRIGRFESYFIGG
ncbi:hypothetical protein AAFN47_27045 [Hoeflea sp. CAU 1731]